MKEKKPSEWIKNRKEEIEKETKGKNMGKMAYDADLWQALMEYLDSQ